MGTKERLAAIGLATSLAACQTAGLGPPAAAGDGESARLAAASADYERTVGEGIALGAVVGGLAGVLIGNAEGGRDGAVRGGLIGAGIGSLIGGAGGVAVAENKRGYVAAEDRLDAEIAEARAARGKLQSLVSVARRLVAKRRAEAAALRRGGPSQAEARRALLAKLKDNQRTLDESIAKAEQQRGQLARASASFSGSPGAGTLAGEAASTGRAARDLARERDALGAIGEGLR